MTMVEKAVKVVCKNYFYLFALFVKGNIKDIKEKCFELSILYNTVFDTVNLLIDIQYVCLVLCFISFNVENPAA